MKSEPGFYQTKSGKLPGTSYKEVHRRALEIYKTVKRKTKRKPYIRSAYFKRQKIFFDYFWIHLSQKSFPEKIRRLQYFAAAVDLLQYSRITPTSKENPNKQSEILHRFGGMTKNREKFYVQIKEHKPTGTKQLMSVFPWE